MNDRLELHNTLDKKLKPIYVDFLSGELKHRQRYGGGEMLARAVGIKAQYKPFVLDTTAGLGTDAFILANLGCHVIMLERSPIIAALLQDGLQRAKQNPELESLQLELILVDAIEYLSRLNPGEYPDVIYLDPMFPERTKTAEVKKEMRMLRNIVGEDLDASKLLSLALKFAKKRVVVKRPRLADCIGGITPSFALKGKSGRFDVYVTRDNFYFKT